jgi:predicted DsbA family dithiol-disulfide isomerase
METAMSRRPDVDFEVRWHPFLLRPAHPLEGVLKSPDTPDNPRVGARMKAAGAAVGIDFTGACDRAPNTVMSHCLLAYCEQQKGAKAQNELQELVFKVTMACSGYSIHSPLACSACSRFISLVH